VADAGQPNRRAGEKSRLVRLDPEAVRGLSAGGLVGQRRFDLGAVGAQQQEVQIGVVTVPDRLEHDTLATRPCKLNLTGAIYRNRRFHANFNPQLREELTF